jgi:chromosome partitioning protein
MRTVAILSQKGGSGKTTLALHLAVAAEKTGRVAAVIDIDPQASASGWKDSRKEETPVVVSIPAARLTQALDAARGAAADLALIDSAPHAGDVALAAAEAADLILIPCRPGILDLRAIGATARIVKLAGKQGCVVLNAMPPNAPNILADAKAAVAVHGLEVAPFTLQQRAAFGHALTLGKTAHEYDPNGKAADEIAKLYQWLMTRLKVVA